MTPQFNLIQDPWLPVKRKNGEVTVLGLKDVFLQASDIVGVAETAPPSLVAQYRLLLAIVHRSVSQLFPAGWTEKDRAAWYRDGLPIQAIVNYLDQWADRFWLFHPTHPFMQVNALQAIPETRDKRKPWAMFSLSSASGNSPAVFDHSIDSNPLPITAEEALRVLLGFLQFTPGGLVKAIYGSDKAGPLSNTAALLPLGENLNQTLMLNLHPFVSRQAVPDLPAWEKKPLTVAQIKAKPGFATGPNDRYTRQSRSVLLERELDGSVRWCRFAEGDPLAENPAAPDPMASFRAGGDKLIRLTFGEGRAVWRDLPALLPNPSGGTQAAAVRQWALSLRERMGDEGNQAFLVAGVASDQAKVLRWRTEQLFLPLRLLEDPASIALLRDFVAQAEELFHVLKTPLVALIQETLPSPSHKDTRKRARAIFENSAVPRGYFSLVEQRFAQVPGLLHSPDKATAYWTECLREAGHNMWSMALREFGGSPLSLRAAAVCSSRYIGALNKQVPRLSGFSS